MMRFSVPSIAMVIALGFSPLALAETTLTITNVKPYLESKGYKVKGDPRAHDKDFIADVTDVDGKVKVVTVFTDGRVVVATEKGMIERQALTAEEARKLVIDKGYQVDAAPRLTDKGFMVDAKDSTGKLVVLQVQPDGNVVIP